MARVGLSFHPALMPWLDNRSNGVECVEILAERFVDSARELARVLSARYPLVVRTQALSLASPEHGAASLASLASLSVETGALWVCDQLGYRYAPGIDLGGACPTVLDRRTLHTVAERATQVMSACGTRILIRNLASPLVVSGEMSEPEFLNRVCGLAGCGISLDVAALLVNARNRRFDPGCWLDAIDRSRVVHVSVGGCREADGYWDDTHDAPIDDDLWSLAADAVRCPALESVTLQWEGRFPPASVLASELRRLKALVTAHDLAGAGH